MHGQHSRRARLWIGGGEKEGGGEGWEGILVVVVSDNWILN